MFDLLNKAVDLRQSLVNDFPEVPNYRYKLAFSLQIVALRQVLGGSREESMPTFRRLIPWLERLHAEVPDVPHYRKMLVQALELYAAGQRLSDNWEQAVETEQRIVTFFENLLSTDPDNVEFMFGMANGVEGMGKCFHKGKEYDKALAQYRRTIELLQPLIERESSAAAATAALRNVLDYRVDVFDTLKRYEEAIADLSRIVELSQKLLSATLRRARLRSLMGEHSAGAAEMAELLEQDDEFNKGHFYNAACVFAVSVAAARTDKELSDDRRETLLAKYAAQAMDCLRRALVAGYFGNDDEIEHLSKDPDFDAIREDKTFTEFRNQLLTNGENKSSSPDQ